jgi:hypothetical protein
VPLETLVLKVKSVLRVTLVLLVTREHWAAQVQKVLLETQEQLETLVLKVK